MGKAQMVKEKDNAEENYIVPMDDLVALCKRRGFIFPASEIYGGINGFWDYGPLGVALKNNLRDRWWQDMVIAPPIGPNGEPLQILGLDSSVIQNPKAWVASGHVGGFSDPRIDCKETKKRYRADHLFILVPTDRKPIKVHDKVISGVAFLEGTSNTDIEKRLKKIGIKGSFISSDGSATELMYASLESVPLANIIGPDAKAVGTLTEPKDFNLMLKTYLGATATEDDIAYLRPETCMGIFLNYKNIVDNMRVRVPFGIAQIGKAFRNEVNPRNFIYRSREFEQMEMEWFCPPEDAKLWHDFWINERNNWWKSVGISSDNMILRPHEKDELVHYAKVGEGTVDIEYKFPFTAPGYGELEGIAHRTDFDLKAHEEHSGKKMEYFDDINKRRFIPHVIEPAAGLTRGVLALLAEAYTADPSRPSKMYMKFKPSLAPIKAAVLPLVNKEGMPEIAQKLYLSMRKSFATQYDAKANIGKRYARHDEIGTPFCITIDSDTANDQAVTIRHRDTMAQERIALDKVEEFILKALKD